MTEQARNALIGQLKSKMQGNADLTNLSNDQLHALTSRALEDRMVRAKTGQSQDDIELSSLNFKEKKMICGAVFESIRGLGVLGHIITDADVTEVMINGFKDIFIEKNGCLSRIENQFESRRELEATRRPPHCRRR